MQAGTLPRPIDGHCIARFRSIKLSWRLALGLVALSVFMVPRLLDQTLYPFGDKASSTLLVIGADEPEHGRSRSDTMLLVRVQLRPERHVTVMALPRDTRVRIPGRRGHDKLNAAFALGGEALLRQTLAANFGMRPDHTLTLLPEGLASLVDAVGGVDMVVPMAMDYDDQSQNLHIHLKPGLQRLNGTQAVNLIRFRKDGRGDLGRIDWQKTFLKTVAQQCLTLSNLLQWNRISPALRQAVHTDLTDHELLGLAYTLRGLQPEELQTGVLPGRPEYIRGVSYYLPTVASAQPELFSSLPVHAGQIDSAQSLLEGQAKPATDKGLMTPQRSGWIVLNGSGRNGYARRAARQMSASGLKVVQIGNVPGREHYLTSQLHVASEADSASLQNRIRQTLGIDTKVSRDDRLPAGVCLLMLGDDFRPASGSQATGI